MISLTGVTKRYGNTLAVNNLDLSIESGEFIVIIGPSGCGKSTTLRMVNRLIEATSGKIEIDGEDISSYRPEELRRRIGYAIQSVGLFPHMTVEKNIGVVPALLKWDEARIKRRVEELLELLSLDPSIYSDKYPAQLSGGEAQRVGVARALAADPSILLMDEPFGALDPITRESLQREFLRVQRELKKTIIFVTHDIDEAMAMGSKIAIMRDGGLIQFAAPEDILENPADRFVREFIGADSALKRLALLKVGPLAVAARTIKESEGLVAARDKSTPGGTLWVTGESGIVKGWVSPKSLTKAEKLSDAITSCDPRAAGIEKDDNLRDALSTMVKYGFKTAPVVDKGGVLIGELSLSAILEA
ncbi:MAG: glycine betaine ABC transporter ATP-binding protein [Deltaproteobacteria bacterium]|nr:MAG: glycine betaine ABC transporter ATP-binding protein [Deltaproteobacteria bacterium]